MLTTKRKKKKKGNFPSFFCICCITTQARNNGLLKRRTDQLSKGPKPGLSDKEPGNIFFHSSNVITSYKHCGKKKKHKEHWEKHTPIHCHQVELTRRCLCFLLPLLNSVVEESLDKRQEKNQDIYCNLNAFVYPGQNWKFDCLCCCSQMQHKQVQELVKFNFHIFLSSKANRQHIADSRTS